jgi:lysophospholipase L1-like esterase
MGDAEVKKKILLVGHSWAADAGMDAKAITVSLPVELEVAAKRSSSVEWSQARLDERDLTKYDAIILFTGINDVNYPAKAKSGLKKLYETASKSNAKVFMFNLPLYNPGGELGKQTESNVKQTNEFLKAFVKKEDLVDIASDNYIYRATRKGADLHPSDKGYEHLRNIMNSRIKEWLDKDRMRGAVPKLQKTEEKKPLQKIPL